MSQETTILVDGRAETQLPVLDRGLMYGDGVFRTIRVERGRCLWWPDHLAKLAADAARLGISSPDPELWQADLVRILEGRGDAVLKLILTRGVGARGYQAPALAQPTRIMIAAPLPAYPEAAFSEGARMRTCTLRLSSQPCLAGIKHMNRLENVLARAEWNDPEIHEGLLLDAEGRVISGVSSNVFIYHAGELLTPALDHCGIAGVARGRVIAAAPRHGLRVRETELRLAEVQDAEAMFLTNSLIGVWRVARLDDRVWPESGIATLVRKCLDD